MLRELQLKPLIQQLFIVIELNLSEMLLSPEQSQLCYLVKLLINNNVVRLAWSLL